MARVLFLAAALSSCWRAASLQAFELPRAEAECSHDQAKAFESLRNGSGSLWLFHVTHNAGTHLVDLLRDHLNEASVHATGTTSPLTPLREGDMQPGHFYYDNLFGEEGLRSAPLGKQVPCGSDRFVSVFPVRDPIPRILAGDGTFITTADVHTDECNSQNYGLRKLIGKGFGEPLTAKDVEFAKRRLDSFDIILDVSTLDDSITSMCAALEWFPRCVLAPRTRNGVATRQDVLKAVGPAVYDKWMKRNAPEIEVYEYAQKLAAEFVQKYPSPMGTPRRRAEETLDMDRWLC